ncbi:hypothetical protein [Georgenia daeguensis]|uniref:Integral membrane protein n=1 Tax=Georgenia daeguensis TaxID=908355 RepID=A0ABP8EPM2_9MICO
MTGSPTHDSRPARTPDSTAERATTEPAAAAADPAGEAAAHVAEPAVPSAEPEVRVADVVDRATVRHAPRFGRFILAGVALGAVAALLLAFLTPPSQYARSDLFWILFLGLGFFCGIAAAGLALVLDRRSLARRKARTAARRTPPAA